MEKKITRSEWNSRMAKQAQKLIRDDKMPTMETVLAAVVDARKNYAAAILAERRKVR